MRRAGRRTRSRGSKGWQPIGPASPLFEHRAGGDIRVFIRRSRPRDRCGVSGAVALTTELATKGASDGASRLTSIPPRIQSRQRPVLTRATADLVASSVTPILQSDRSQSRHRLSRGRSPGRRSRLGVGVWRETGG